MVARQQIPPFWLVDALYFRGYIGCYTLTVLEVSLFPSFLVTQASFGSL